MRRFTLMLAAAALAMSTTAYVRGQPVPKFYTTLDDDASVTVTNGTIVNPPSSYVAGAIGNAFAGNQPPVPGNTNNGRWISWGNSAVATIFESPGNAWNDALGSTVDLYFRGDHWSTHTGDSGLWALWARGGTNESHMLIEVQNGKLRMPYRKNSTTVTVHLLSGVTLADNTTYRLTVRQLDTVLEVYLNGTLVYTGTQTGGTVPLPSGGTTGRQMVVGSKTQWSAGALQAGEWVDNVRVYNGYYSPSDIDTGGSPTAVIGTDKTNGPTPLTVNFNGSGSFDTDATNVITLYQWDFDNNGTVDATGSTTSHAYTSGDYVCKLTVTDDENQTASSTVAIHVAPAGLLVVTDMLPTGGPLTGSQILTSITAGGFTVTDLVGPTVADVSGGTGEENDGLCDLGAESALLGLELGRMIAGAAAGGRFYFPAAINGDGTGRPDVFVLEHAGTTDTFNIDLLTNSPGQPTVVAATVAVQGSDYAPTSTLMTSFGGGIGGVGIDLDVITPAVANITGVQLPGGTGLDPCLVAAVPPAGFTIAPVAVMYAQPTSGGTPLPVGFDASCGSYDPDGTLSYEWDFTTNGSTDATGLTASYTYTSAGDFLATLTVRDSDNLTAADTATISITGANPKRRITDMLPSGTLAAGSHPLTSLTTEMPGTGQLFTTTSLAGPPDAAHVLVLGSGITGSGAGATTPEGAMVGLELGSTVAGLNAPGEFLTGYFADDVLVNPDGTNAPEVFVVESCASRDTFQIELLTSGPGETEVVVATVQVYAADYASTATSIDGTPRGGMGIDLDALGVTGIRGVRIPGADGQGSGTGIDPVVIAGIPTRCNTPFADADGDGDVDQTDFAAFQSCFTGSNPAPGVFDSARCFCFDHNGGDSDVDELDYSDFEDYATGPGIPWSQAN